MKNERGGLGNKRDYVFTFIVQAFNGHEGGGHALVEQPLVLLGELLGDLVEFDFFKKGNPNGVEAAGDEADPGEEPLERSGDIVPAVGADYELGCGGLGFVGSGKEHR